MKRTPKIRAIHSNEIPALFQSIETELKKRSQKIRITVLGGLAIILQGFRERATYDIDIADGRDAAAFAAVCRQLSIPVDIITIASTVDLSTAPTTNSYQGLYLTVDAIQAEDLIKLKLERFLKQDPEDIYAIIDKTALPYETFERLVREMKIDFIGDPRRLMLQAQVVVEQKYPEKEANFATLF